MALLDIRTYGDDVLRKKSGHVEKVTPELVQLAEDMLETMYEAAGCGLAAPQIGKNIRLVVIDISRPDDGDEKHPFIMFNPEWEEEPDSEPVTVEEGCLSIPEIWINVTRPGKVTVRYTDEKGEAREINHCEGIFARAIQHESDHLDGKLFVDKISPADRSLNESKLKKMAKKKG
ncbi:MAG: peptide deformylase [Fibrobacter sp.]|jgi:peptide deformylase|nr:peptide deformylase [Fibrobacter sp.]